jgi:hypothetical protein
MQPVMMMAWFWILVRCVKYSRKTNHMIHQVLLDATGSEVTFIYKNQFLRKLRSDQLETTLLVSNLVNPP